MKPLALIRVTNSDGGNAVMYVWFTGIKKFIEPAYCLDSFRTRVILKFRARAASVKSRMHFSFGLFYFRFNKRTDFSPEGEERAWFLYNFALCLFHGSHHEEALLKVENCLDVSNKGNYMAWAMNAYILRCIICCEFWGTNMTETWFAVSTSPQL